MTAIWGLVLTSAVIGESSCGAILTRAGFQMKPAASRADIRGQDLRRPMRRKEVAHENSGRPPGPRRCDIERHEGDAAFDAWTLDEVEDDLGSLRDEGRGVTSITFRRPA